MSTRLGRSRRWSGLSIALLLVVGLGVMAPEPAAALEHRQGEFKISWGTTLSYGAMWRVADRDPRLIGIANKGTALSVNGDDGNLNYDRGLVSNALKATTEIELSYKSFGSFVRVYGFYDYENEKGTRARRPLTDGALDRVGSRAEVRDAFIWYKASLGSVPVELRAGNQVLSWGESTFIQNGINVINPVDVSALRVPGAELRDALLPVGLVHASVGTSTNTSFEAFYQYRWEQTKVDPPGTYFSTSDIAGADASRVMLGFGSVPDTLPLGPMPPPIGPVGAVVPRGADRDASDSGQWGLAFRWYAPSLAGTDFGLYYINYHSRLPMISARAGTLAGLMGGNYVGSAYYFLEYPENINLYGISFNTTLGSTGVALQGELSHRRNLPLQIDDVELLFAALSPLRLVGSPVGQLLANTNQIGRFGFGEEIRGYRRFEVSQFQTTATKVLGRWLGADQLTLVWEGAISHIHSLPGRDVQRLEGPATYTSGNPVHTQAGVQPATEAASAFPGATAWGYQLAGRFDYNNAIGAVNLAPRFSWQHDVNGVSPGPGGNFLKDRKALTVGVTAAYRISWEVDLSYTRFSGAGRYNLLSDRDFIATNVKYSF